MSKLYGSLLRLVRDERGQDMVEYALLAGFIAVAAGALLPPHRRLHQHHIQSLLSG